MNAENKGGQYSKALSRQSSGDYYDQFDFDDQNDEKVEAMKIKIIEEVKSKCLEIAVRKVVPVDVMAVFEIKSAEETIDRSEELR